MFEYINNLKIDYEMGDPVKDEVIYNAEKKLDILFGKEYKVFLHRFGCFSIKYMEFYGLCGSNDSSPNTIHITSKIREEIPNFPKNLVVIYEIGNGDFYSIDSNDMVYFCQYDKCVKENISFEEFLYKKIEELNNGKK